MTRPNPKLPLLLLATFVLLLPACQQSTEISPAAAKEIARLETQLEEVADERDTLKGAQQNRSTKKLVHVVWFQLKDDADETALVAEIRKLSEIPGVLYLQIGKFQELGDKRAMSHLDLVMQMSFKDKADYDFYQEHSVHQQLKKDIGQYIDAPPVTYDYWTYAPKRQEIGLPNGSGIERN